MAAVAAARRNRPEAGVETRVVVAAATREAAVVAVATVVEAADITAAVAIAAGADVRQAGARIQESEDRRKPLVFWLLIFLCHSAPAFRLPIHFPGFLFSLLTSDS
jgi:hypothetical protein